MKFTFTKIWPVLAATALLANACSGASEPGEANGADDSNEAAAISDSSQYGGSTDSDDSEAGPPLAEFFGQGYDIDSEDGQARFSEDGMATQEKIADCMRAEGFEYIPYDNSSDFILPEAENGVAFGSREFAERYGLGVSTRAFSQEQVGPDLIGSIDTGTEREFVTDPNEEIVEAMDEPTREAYDKALYSKSDGGCNGEAYSNERIFVDFADELAEINKVVDNDPRVTEMRQEISECIRNEGIEVEGGGILIGDFYADFENQVAEIRSLLGGDDDVPGADLTEEQFEAMTEEELDALFDRPPLVLTDEAKTKLAEVQQREIRTAITMWDCGLTEDGEFFTLYQEVHAEYEQRFVEENADRLEEYKPNS